MKTILSVKDLTKSYGKRIVLDSISFDIHEQEIVGFIGPNGAGKSTLMKCLCGLLKVDQGTIYVCGHNLEKEREKALSSQASMIESPGLFFNMSGYENLSIFGSLKHVSKERIQEMAEYTRIGEYLKKPVSSYSLGMKQRLALSISLLSSPKFLMLDEPMNGLDPTGVFELRKELKYMVQNQGMSLLISSHQLNEVEKIANRIIYIEDGKIKEAEKRQVKILYRIRVDKKILDSRFEEKADFVYTFQIKKSEELEVVLQVLHQEEVHILDITKISEDLEQVYAEIYGESV